MKPWRALLTAITVALAASGTVMSQSPDELGVGIWKLNVAKSKFEPGPGPKSETRIYAAMPDGLRMTSQLEMANGKSRTEMTAYKFDGKPYSFSNNPNIDAIEVIRISRWETHATEMRAGQVVGHVTRVVSTDGTVLTMTSDVTTRSGRFEHEVRVYDRQ